MKTMLHDQNGEQSVCVEVAEEQCGLVIYPAGFGYFGCANGTAGPILLELYEGRLRLVVWDDINLEDPSHIIDLQDARDDQRRDTVARAVRLALIR